MALNTLKIATSGYLKRTTKAVLVIAVSGYLNYTEMPPNPPNQQTGDGYGNYYKKGQERNEKIRIEDSEIIAIVQLCLKTTIL